MKYALLAVAIPTFVPSSFSVCAQTSTVQGSPIQNPALASPLAAQACCQIASGTPVSLELLEPVGSKDRRRGDTFEFKLASPLIIDGVSVVPAGVHGFGEVVDAARGGIAGRPAKLILAARYLIFQGRHIPLHGLRLSGAGADKASTAILVSAAISPILSLAVSGGDVQFPAGTRATAKTTGDVTITLPPPATPAPPSPPGLNP